MRPVLVFAVVTVFSTAAFAEEKTLTLGIGDCQSRELGAAVARFEELVLRRQGPSGLPGKLAIDIVRPRSSRSLEDLTRQVETARTLFYSGQTNRALTHASQAIGELRLVAPPLDPWPAMVDALLVQVLVYRHRNDHHRTTDVLRRIARLDPGRVLDPGQYAPTLRAAFEQAARETPLGGALSVTSTPAGARVYLEGKLLGVTPLNRPLPPGTYRLQLTSESRTSFSHDVTIRAGSVDERIDLAFEGAIASAEPVCINLPETQAIGAATRLAGLVGVEQLVVVSLINKPGDPPVIKAQLVADGIIERSATIHDDRIDGLVDFMLEGTPLPGPTQLTPPPQPAAAPVTEPAPPPAPVPLSPPPPAKVGAVATMIAGGAIALGASVLAGVGLVNYSQLQASRTGRTYDLAALQYAEERHTTNLSLGVAAGGLLLTAIGALWFFFSGTPL